MIPSIALDGPTLLFGGPYSNLQATRAVLAEAARRGIPPSRVICTGDVAAYGGDPAATVDVVAESGIHVIRGNCEEQLGAGAADCGCGFAPGTACDALSARWFAHASVALGPVHRAWMAALPARLSLALPDGRWLAVLHGGAESINRFLFPSAAAAVLAAELAATGADGVVAGHAGIPFLRGVGGRLWCNAGAVGLPAHDGTPRGWFAILTTDPSGVAVTLQPLDYDHTAAAAAMRAARLPEDYARALETGLWPSEDVLPEAERATRGVALTPAALHWPRAAA